MWLQVLARPVFLATLAVFFEAAYADLDFVSYDYGYVASDSTCPRLLGTSPANGATGIPVDTEISITLSEKVMIGQGHLMLTSSRDIRTVLSSDAQVSVNASTNFTVIFQLGKPLQTQTEYNVEVSPGFVVDFAGNNFQGCRFNFHTGGEPVSFAAFAPWLQAPDSPVMFAFLTGDHGMYGSSTDQYFLTIYPSHAKTFPVPSTGADGMEENCARVTEISANFPSIDRCRVSNGRFEIVLREVLLSATEYSLVVRWPVLADASNTTEVTWDLSVSRTYYGITVEVQHFAPWRHYFGDYLFNNVDDSQGAVLDFNVTPVLGASSTEWLGPSTTREFLVEVLFSSPGCPAPGSHMLLFASPLMGWSINPRGTSTLSELQLLAYLDTDHLSDAERRASPCLRFFPGDLPYTSHCRHLELAFGAYSYGLELRLPARGTGAQPSSNAVQSFNILLPGPPQPLALISHWDIILVHAAAAGSVNSVHSARRQSRKATVLNTTAGMSLRVISSEYPYPTPVGTRVNKVELEFVLGTYVQGHVEVWVELLEPSRARVEACGSLAGAPRLTAKAPTVTDEPVSRIRWELLPPTSIVGPQSYTAYPRTRYRTICLIYNGPHSVPLSYWRLGLVSNNKLRESITLSRTFASPKYFVATMLAGAQVTPTMPLLGRRQVLLVRATLPANDGITLRHWTTPARRLQLVVPAGFNVPGGPCIGFKSVTSSALPPVPLSRCTANAGFHTIEVSMDSEEAGFEPGRTYAFHTVLGNPDRWDAVQSRIVGGRQVQRANCWSISVLNEDGLPLALLEDVPPVYSRDTAALRPEFRPGAHDTSFRVFPQPLVVHAFSAENHYLGHTTRVAFKFAVSTPLRSSDVLQITAPSGFAWVQLARPEHDPQRLHGTKPFPGTEIEVGPVPWLIRLAVSANVQASLPYGLLLNVSNPTAWSELDQDLNFWTLETFYDLGGVLDMRSRHDVAVHQGYLLKGALTYCGVIPLDRARGATTWASLTFKLNEPVFYQTWTQPNGPSRLEIRVPKGFKFAMAPEEQNCTGVLLAKALPDSPPLPRAQFPHGYSPLEDLSGFSCTLDSDHLEAARTLILQAVQQESFGLLPHILYAFQLHIVNPMYDRIFSTEWKLRTVGHTGAIYEQCLVDSLPSLEPARATLVPAKDQAGVDGTQSAHLLPTQQTAVAFEFTSASLVAGSPGLKTLVILAPPGYSFLRHCAAQVHGLPQDGILVGPLSCDGHEAEAALQLNLSSAAAAVVVTVYVRLPSRVHAGRALTWSISSLTTQAGFQTAGLVGPAARAMEQLTLQPVGISFFRVRSGAQRAVFAVSPAAPVPASGLLEVGGPWRGSLAFDGDQPCAALWEDPVVLGVERVASAVLESGSPCNALGAANSVDATSSCQWPPVTACTVLSEGTRLTIRTGEALKPGAIYCFEVRLVSLVGHAGPAPPLSASLRAGPAGAAVDDLAPAIMSDGGGGWGVAPFVGEVAHLSLCYHSRVPGRVPRDLTVRFMPSSLGISSAGAATEGRICFDGTTTASDGAAVCNIHLPTPANPSRIESASSSLSLSQGPSCTTLPLASCRGVCVALRGRSLWASNQPVVMSLPVLMLPGIVPRVDLQIFDAMGSVMQGSTTSLGLPVLNQLDGLGLSAPSDASTAAAFSVLLAIDWSTMGRAFLEKLVEMEGEEPAFLDVSPPLGLRISLSCRPMACRRIVLDTATLQPGVRLLLHEAAPDSWWRRLQRGRQLIGKATDAAGICQLREGCNGGACCATAGGGSGSSQASLIYNTSRLPAEVRLFVTASRPLTPFSIGNVWDFVLRSHALHALGALALPGFGVARRMEVRVEALSLIAGDVFSRLVVTMLLEVPLAVGDAILLLSPSTEIPCRPELVEPTQLVGPLTAAMPHQLPGSCAIELRRSLNAGISYSFDMPLANPAKTPEPNTWLVQTLSRIVDSRSRTVLSWEAHSVAEAPGFKVAGEFEFVHILPKSAAPKVFTPAAVKFKLRTPLPALPLGRQGPGLQEPAVRLRLVLLNGSDMARVSAFDPRDCLLDILQAADFVETASDAELLKPDDCLVTDGGAALELLFGSAPLARRAYTVWTRLRNPSFEASSNPAWTYSMTTIIRGSHQPVHHASLRPAPLLGLWAAVAPGSHAVGVTHRAVVSILAGKIILGQRGAIEVTLPHGFGASCSLEHFRPRPALPETAQCLRQEASGQKGGVIIVHWRSLLRMGGLRPPYEFSFALTNSDTTVSDPGTNGSWHIRIFEGEDLEFPMDGTPPVGLRPFDLCPSLTLSIRREDSRIISITFKARQEIPKGFENLIRVELRSSARAPAELACPETSVWQKRPERLHSVQGLPKYTVCVPEPPEHSLPAYEETARQHVSAVLFLLPFRHFAAAEPYGLEVIVERVGKGTRAGLSPSEEAAELVGLRLESRGLPRECMSVPLRVTPAGSASSTDETTAGSGATDGG